MSSELLMCGGGVCNILLLPLVAGCVYMVLVCFYVCCSDCGNVWCLVVIVEDSVFLSLGVLKYGVCLCKGCDGYCVFCLYCDMWSCGCSCMGSMSVFHHAYVVCLCLVCILWQFLMLHYA